MRKIKIKAEKNKSIEKKLDYSVLLGAFAYIVDSIKLIFNVSSKELLDYVNKGIKPNYKSDVINDTYYPNITSYLNRLLKIIQSMKKEDVRHILKNKKLNKVVLNTITTRSTLYKKEFLKQDKVDFVIASIITFLASYETIADCIYANREILLKNLTSNEIKNIRTFITQSKECFSAILYDMCNTKSYYLSKGELK